MTVLSNALEINPLNWGLQQISSGFKSITINPIKDIISYAVPWTKAALDRHVYVSKESLVLMEFMGGNAVVNSIQQEVSQLALAAGINGGIDLYTSVSAPFSGYRGIFGKVVTFPIEYTPKEAMNDIKMDERLLTNDELKAEKRKFSDNEIRYLLSTAVAEMTIFPLLKVIARITILALMIGLFFTPLGIYSGGATFAVGAVLYFAINRFIGNRVDKYAQELLKQRFENAGMDVNAARVQSAIVGINTLRKIQQQQLELRNLGWIAKLLINSEGDLRFDYTRPSLKKRIQMLQGTAQSLAGIYK